MTDNVKGLLDEICKRFDAVTRHVKDYRAEVVPIDELIDRLRIAVEKMEKDALVAHSNWTDAVTERIEAERECDKMKIHRDLWLLVRPILIAAGKGGEDALDILKRIVCERDELTEKLRETLREAGFIAIERNRLWRRLEKHHKSMGVDVSEECPCCKGEP